MFEMGKPQEVSEIRPPAVENYRDIKPQENTTPEEARSFWDDFFGGGETSKEEIPEVNGGRYKDVKEESDSEKYEVHHILAACVLNIDYMDGPAIKMEKEDHRQTASWGNSMEARAYQEMQREYIEQGRFREAVQMDIEDIQDKFGDKYDEAIAQMLAYVDKLELEGKISG